MRIKIRTLWNTEIPLLKNIVFLANPIFISIESLRQKIAVLRAKAKAKIRTLKSSLIQYYSSKPDYNRIHQAVTR